MPAHRGVIRATSHGPDRPDDWRAQAACADDPTPDRWFPLDSQRDLIRQLRTICGGCEVRDQCFEGAMTDKHEGFWGGTTAAERARIRKGKPPVTKPGPKRQPIAHGTPAGEKAHYRHGEKPCEPCSKAAYAARLRRKSA